MANLTSGIIILSDSEANFYPLAIDLEKNRNFKMNFRVQFKIQTMNETFLTVLVGLSLASMLSLYILAVVDVHKRNFRTLSERGRWLAIIWLLPLVGSAFYLLRGRKTGIRK